MFKSTLLLAAAALVGAQSNQPCATVSAALSQASVIPAQAAFDCLDSVPVDTQGNSKLIDQLKQVWQFQSELVWLKNPGNDWEFGPLDIIGELDKIKNSLNSFRSEYAVQLAIQNITIRTGNFHFNYMPDILQVFSFIRPFNVGSVSSDGTSLPKMYVYDDIEPLASGSKDVSEIQSINGQNPYDFLRANSWGQYIDSDGLINNMFAKGDTQHPGAFAQQAKFDGNNTEIKWANGSSTSFRNLAGSSYSFRGVTDGKTFFQKFCTGSISGIDADSASTKGPVSPHAPGPIPTIPEIYHTRTKRDTIPTSAYPSAVARDPSGVVAGYFLNGNGYQDVAVLKIISFSNPDSKTNSTKFNNGFQSTVKNFLSQCISQKKQKLIIDLRENGGGATSLLLDTFMQLFPSMEPFSGQRYRATDAFNKIGDGINEIYNSPDLARQYSRLVQETIQNGDEFRFWSWWHFRRGNGTNFASWNEFKGPLDLNSDKFTVTMRYNYSNSDRVSILEQGFNFVNDANRQQPFDSKNVVMFTDALCGSSCASFHEELKNIAGVKAVTVGGRPQNKPIQTVTGSKGGEVLPLFVLAGYGAKMLNVTDRLKLNAFKANDATLSSLANIQEVYTRVGDTASRAQSQDQIRKGDKSATPLQYIYEASDCRIFYTPETFGDADSAWKQAWDAFNDNKKCVSGSTGHKSSISGGYTPYGPGELKTEDQPAEPAGSGSSSNGGNGGSNAAPSVKSSGALMAFAAAIAVGLIL